MVCGFKRVVPFYVQKQFNQKKGDSMKITILTMGTTLYFIAWCGQLCAQDRYAGVWREGSDGYYLSNGLDWDGFTDKWAELGAGGLRLIDVETYMDGSTRKYTGVWREGSDGYYLSGGLDWTGFVDKWAELGAVDLRLIDLETYLDNGTRRYIGVWREGNDGYYLSAGLDWTGFVDKWTELAAVDLRLIDLETYVDNGIRKFAGVWLSGSDGYYLSAGVDWSTLKDKWAELAGQNLRLIDLETYVDGGVRKYAGVWRGGSDPHYLWAGVDWENFVSKWVQLGIGDLRLTDLETYGGGCQSDCANQVVGTPYAYQVTGEGLYSAPFVTINAKDYIRFSAISFADQFLTLPFSDVQVARGGIWRYNSGDYHYAGDYSKNNGDDTFEVKAAAAGTVVFIGWDNWSGNTIILSHDEGGVTDAYRTIYMHLRNGASNDCNAAWNNSIPGLSGQNLTDFTTHLNDTGCTQDPALRSLDADHWGTETETINVTLNQVVQRGDVLAWSGNTGPGGKRGSGGPNTHLHIFWARRDLTDNQWYFFDPYGIYALPDCYPTGITDPLNSPCARYPIAWKDGIPQYP